MGKNAFRRIISKSSRLWATALVGAMLFSLASTALIWAAPILTAQKTVTVSGDVDGDGKADQGDTLTYSVLLNNTGTDPANNLAYTDTLDANTTLVPGSLQTTPLALNDSYTAIGNISLTVSATGLLANDFGLPAPSVTPATLTTSQGGSVTVDADGYFVYTPDTGFSGIDTFTYTITNSQGSDSATASITVGPVVWFVDNAAATDGDGSMTAPFKCLAGANCLSDAAGVNTTGAGDIIFIYRGSGAYTSGKIVLKNDQKLLGQSVNLNSVLGPPPGGITYPLVTANPQISNAGDIITLADDNTIRGLDLSPSAGTAITASSKGGTTIVDAVAITPTGSARGIYLTGQGGSFSYTNGSINSSAAISYPAFALLQGLGTIDVSVPITSQNGKPVDVQNKTGGTVNFNNLITGNGDGINLANNTGSTINFSGGLALTTGAYTALNASGGGTLNVTGSSNTLSTTSATALNVSSVTIGTNGLTFRSIASNGGSSTGIILNNTGSTRGLTVTGVSSAGSGGTIANKSGGDGNTTSGVGIYLNNTTGASLTYMQLNDFSNFAILGSGVTNLTLDRVTISGVNGTNEANDEGSLSFDNLLGNSAITNSNISGGYTNNVRVANTSGALNRLTVSSTTIGANNQNFGDNGLVFESRSTATMNLTVTGSTFSSSRGDLLQTNALDTSTMDVDLVNNTFANGHTNILSGSGGVTISGASTASNTVSYLVDDNTFSGAHGPALNVFKGAGSGTFSGRITNNVIGVDGSQNTGSLESDGIRVTAQGLGKHTTLIEGNTVQQYNNQGIALRGNTGAGALNATLRSNILRQPGALAIYGLSLQSGMLVTDTNTVCAMIGGANPNTLTGSGAVAGQDFRLSQQYAANVTLPGYSGGSTDTAAVAAFVQGNNSGASGVVFHAGAGGFTNSAGCEQPVAREAIGPSLANAAPGSSFSAMAASTTQGADAGIHLAAAPGFQIAAVSRSLSSNPLRVLSDGPKAPLASGETINAGPFNLPAGKSITITYRATVNNPVSLGATQVCNQGAFSGTGIPSFPTDDPSTPAVNDATCTLLSFHTDLTITKTDGQSTAIPGQTVTYTLVALNAGPSIATGATVADSLPAVLSGATWTCAASGGAACPHPNGTGSIHETVDLPVAGSLTYTLTATIHPAATGALSNTATITPPAAITELDEANNSATDSDTLTPQADLAITKTDGLSTAVPGQPVTYTITASNAGPSHAPGVTVADTLPAALTGTWTCVGAGGGVCTAAGSGNIVDMVTLPAGGSVTYTVSAILSPAATGVLSNTASLTPPAGVTDPNPANNSATDSDTLTPQADLAITKTDGVSTAVPGQPVTYTITASNGGPSYASGAIVADTLPAALSGTWTCVGAGGGICAAAGSNSIADTVTLPPGGSVTYTLTADIHPSATGALSNTATLAPPAGATDPNPANNSATDNDTLTPQADLAITKTDGQSAALQGATITYTLTATSSGPSDATAARVTDTLPVVLSGVTWTCSASGGAGCPASGSGNIDQTIDLTPGGSATFTVTGQLAPAFYGLLSNTATLAPPAGVIDPSPANNSATDITAVDAPPVITSLTVTPPAVQENGSTDLAFIFTDPDLSEPHTLAIDWGDSTNQTVNLAAGVLSGSVAHQYFDDNPTATPLDLYTISVTLSEADGGQASQATPVMVQNVAPALSGLAATSVNEGSSTTFSGTISDPGTLDSFTLWVNWGDGSAPQSFNLPAGSTAFSETHLYANNPVGPSFLIQATLTDDDGGSDSDSTSVLVQNVAPLVNAGPDDSIVVGDTYTGAGSISDPGSDTWTASVDYGDGTGLQPLVLNGKLFDLSHVYTADGVYTLTVSVSDSDGAAGSDTVQVTVAASTDLELTKTIGDNPALTGSTQVYTLTVTNHGPSNATGVVVTDMLPAEVTPVSASPSCTPSGQTFTCAIGALASGASASVDITATINLDAPATITNAASVTGDQLDENAANNSITLDTQVLPSLVIYEGDFSGEPLDEWNFPITSTTPSGRSFLGEFNNQDVRLILQKLPQHSKATLTFDLFIIRSWDGNQTQAPGGTNLPMSGLPVYAVGTPIGPDEWMLQEDGATLLHTTFSNWVNTVGAYRQAYPGSYPGGDYPPQSGAAEVRALGYNFGGNYLDAVYHITYTFDHAEDILTLDFSAMGLQPIADESWGLDNVVVTLSGGADLLPHRFYIPYLAR